MFPPLTTGYEDRNGTITEQDIAFYTRLAEGGAGYIVIGDVAPIQNFTPTPRLFDDAQIESFRKLADSVHAVSYTHLDVYKRQILFIVIIGLGCYNFNIC